MKSFNTRQAAEYLTEELNIPTTAGTLEVWRCQGRGPRYRKVRRRVFYDRAALDEFARGAIVETVDSHVFRQ